MEEELINIICTSCKTPFYCLGCRGTTDGKFYRLIQLIKRKIEETRK